MATEIGRTPWGEPEPGSRYRPWRWRVASFVRWRRGDGSWPGWPGPSSCVTSGPEVKVSHMRSRASEGILGGRPIQLRLLPVLLACVLIGALVPGSASWAAGGTLAARAEALGLTCAAETSSDDVSYTK